MATRPRRAAPCLALAALAACGAGTNLPAPSRAVTGHVTYRERMALPPDAELRIAIVDASRADASRPVADTTLPVAGGQVPLPFSLPFDRGRINPRRDYAIHATITSGGKPLFTTPLVVRVITHDHPTQVDLVLARAPGTAVPEPTPARGPAAKAPGLVGTKWVLEDIGGTGVIEGVRATLEFPSADRASGSGSCNRFSGGVTIGDSTIVFSRMISTKIACAPPIMAQETKYLQALQDAKRYAQDGASLAIYANGMEKPLRFTRE
jgi:putative lipoprotein